MRLRVSAWQAHFHQVHLPETQPHEIEGCCVQSQVEMPLDTFGL